jgi:hypothetical protein
MAWLVCWFGVRVDVYYCWRLGVQFGGDSSACRVEFPLSVDCIALGSRLSELQYMHMSSRCSILALVMAVAIHT